MTRDFLNALTRRYRAYVDTFRDPDGRLPEMLQLKLDHTLGVVADARRIMAGEGWPEPLCVLGEACALLHDAGRYSQIREFGTFQDSRSIDHARRGVEVIERERWLAPLPDDERKEVLASVALHNRKEVPASLKAEAAELTHMVRDADKLDIFRVMEVAIADGSLERNPEIAWDLQTNGLPSPELVDAVSRGRAVSYTWIKSLSDFVLIQVGWLNGGMHFRTALQLARERRVLEFREAYLKTLTGDAGVDRCCAAARAHMSERLGTPTDK